MTQPQKNSLRARLFCFAASILLVTVAVAQANVPPLKVSGNGRLLVQQGGKPFFWNGCTNWRLYKLTPQEVNQYLDNRKSRGFNVIQGPVLLHGSTGPEFRTPSGATNTNPLQPNHAYFQHIDYIVNAANQRGMYVALVAVWGEDWWIFPSTSAANHYGRFLGERYRNHNNVIWIVAGEYSHAGEEAHILNRWNALANGIRQGSGGKQLVTIHASYQPGKQSSSVHFHNKQWLDFNMIQSSQTGNHGSGADNWNLVLTDWQKNPKKPTMDAEANYERIGPWHAFGVRRRAYWSVFAGGFGHTYGAASVWQSYRHGIDEPESGSHHDWTVAINYSGAKHMRHLKRLIESRPMMRRVPDQSVLVSHDGDVPHHIRATRHNQGRYFMVYIPRSNEPVTVRMDKINASHAKAWWYNPRNGKATLIGTFPAAGFRTFTTPAGPDWVLVVDDASKNWKAPGKGGPKR